jgi:hypothetical protein
MRECGGSRRTVVDAGAEPLLALGLLALLAEAEEAELLLNSGMGIISLAAVADVVPVPLRLEEEDAVAPPPRPRRCSEEEDEDDGAWLFAAAAVWRVSTSTMTRSCEILCSSIFKYSRLFSGPPFSLSSNCPAGETSAAALIICSL